MTDLATAEKIALRWSACAYHRFSINIWLRWSQSTAWLGLLPRYENADSKFKSLKTTP